MRTLKRTAIASAAAQVALLCCGVALAQTTTEPAPEDTTATKAVPAAAGAVKLDTVVVTGQRKALETAQKRKQNAEEIIDSVTADEAGKLPDKSITEVLQRVTGVTMDHTRIKKSTGIDESLKFNPEGAGIQIRGLSWGSSTLNGRESFSAGWPGRELSWGDVTPTLMAGVDVYKNPSAELIEGGISGQINLRTRLPFDSDKDKSGAFSFTDGHSGLGGKDSPSFSGMYSTRWDSPVGKLGALIDLSYGKSTYRTDTVGLGAYYPRLDLLPKQSTGASTIAWVPSAVNWGTGTGETERAGFYGALQWKKNEKESSMTYFDSGFRGTDTSTSIYSDTEDPYKTTYSNTTFNSAGAFQSGTLSFPAGGYGANQFAAGGIRMGTNQKSGLTNGRTRELTWNFKWAINDRWAVQNDLQWVHSTNDTTNAQINLATYMPSMGLNVATKMPTLSFDQNTTNFLADPKNYYWEIGQPSLSKAKADLYAWKVDAKFKFDDPVLRDLRFGMRLTERESTHQNAGGSSWWSYSQPWAVAYTKKPGSLPTAEQISGWPNRANFGYMSDPNYQFPDSVTTFAFPNFFNGQMASPPTIVVPTMSLVQDMNSYQMLNSVLVQECKDANMIRGYATWDQKKKETADATCATAAKDWKPMSYDSSTAKDISTHSENTQAIYGSLRFGFDDWKYPVEGNAGLRVVRTHTVAHGYTTFKPGTNNDPSVPQFAPIDQPLDTDSTTTDYLPSLNIKTNWSPTLQSRLAMSQGIYRPGFDQLQEYITLNQSVQKFAGSDNIQKIVYSGTNSGNVKLKPVKSDNFDLSLEWYPRNGQSLTAVVFYKEVKDVIMSTNYTRTLTDIAGNSQDFVVTGPDNAARIRESGIEIGGMTYLDKIPGLEKALPEWAKGFGVSANFTHLEGKQELYHPYNMQYCPQSGNGTIALNLYGCDTNGLPFKVLPVPYMSKKAYNIGFMYDKGPISARLAYSWRDRTLAAINAYGTGGNNATSADPARIAANGGVAPADVGYGLPVWDEAAGQWDAGVSYKISERMSASFNVSNLTDEVFTQTYQQAVGSVGRSWSAPGRSYFLAVNYWF